MRITAEKIISAVLLLSALVGCSPSVVHQEAHPKSWNHKAVANIKLAARIAGGFTNREASLYRMGLKHIHNRHQPPGSYSIAQIVDQENQREDVRRAQRVAEAERLAQKQREQRQLAQAKREEAERRDREANEPCTLMHTREEASVDALNANHFQTAYDAATSGLASENVCGNDTSFVTKGYLLSMKAIAEHSLSAGDSRTDLNQANALLEECVTQPGMYGESVGANCETQIHNNITYQTDWDTNN